LPDRVLVQFCVFIHTAAFSPVIGGRCTTQAAVSTAFAQTTKENR